MARFVFAKKQIAQTFHASQFVFFDSFPARIKFDSVSEALDFVY